MNEMNAIGKELSFWYLKNHSLMASAMIVKPFDED